MRASISLASMISLVCLYTAPMAQAQVSPALPGCDATPEVRAVIDTKLDGDLLDKMKFDQRVVYERKILEDLMARSPRELQPYQSYLNFVSQNVPNELPALRARWVQAAKEHPDDPLAQLLAAKVLTGRDTPQAIALLEAAHAMAPHFAWPDLALASIYSTGQRADLAKTRQNLEAFFALCPGSTDNTAQWLLNKDQPFQSKVAADLRTRLASETDPKRLEDYETLWGLEFRTHPPKEHDAVRAQVALDLKRLEAVHPHGDAEWESFLVGGYKQSGADKATVTAMEDRLLRDYPHANEAYDIVYDRWDKAHAKPTDQTDTAAWTAYHQAYKEALKGWIAAYPDQSYLQHYALFYAVYNDDDLAEKDGIPLVDAYVDYIRDYQAPRWQGEYYPNAASFLIKHKWQPARALDLMLQAKAAIDSNRKREDDQDNLSKEQVKDRDERRFWEDNSTYGDIVRASILAGKPAAALQVKAEIEVPVPTDKNFLSGYWTNRGRLAKAENHPQDALAYYQLALITRTSAPKAYQGKVKDELGDEVHDLWKAQGGSETAWALWSKPQGAAADSAEGRWEKPTKTIPDFELSDMSGKTWKLKELAGKTVLINLWATWCGPCQAELPQLQAFYEKNKDRKDIQILTFDIDEDLGQLAPFLKEKGYTFPVLPAYSTVVSLLDGFAIPQTWLVDPHGVWQLKQIGFGGGSQADFDKDMLSRLDLAKGGQ